MGVVHICGATGAEMCRGNALPRHPSTHRFKLMPARQAMAQPLTEEQVQLRLFIRLVHRFVGVRVNATETTGVLGANDFGHARVVVDLHFHLGHRQPGQAVFLTHLQGGGIRALFSTSTAKTPSIWSPWVTATRRERCSLRM